MPVAPVALSPTEGATALQRVAGDPADGGTSFAEVLDAATGTTATDADGTPTGTATGTDGTETDGTGTADADGTTATDADGAAPAGEPATAAHELPTLTLGEMVNAIIEGPSPQDLQRDGGVSTANLRVGGAQGVSADRPLAGQSGQGAVILDAGEQYLGVPYKWGGTDPNVGFDCSGFIQRVFKDLGVDIPRVSKDQSRAGQAVPSMDQAQPGDLVYWNGAGGRPNHIGIYAGDGMMLHAPSSGKTVEYAQLRREAPHAIRRVM